MTILTAELVARLKDMVSGPAAKAGRALDGLVRKSNQASRGGGFARFDKGLESSAKGLIAFGGAAAVGAYAVKSYRDFAAFDRQMTRIGITAEATAGEVANAKKQLFDIANNTGLGVDTVREGLDTLTAAGRNMKDSLAFLPSVAKTAQASGAEVADIANTADAIGNSMGITSDKMQGAFDILAKAGKAGKFELKDMAQYLPAIAPAAAAIGMKGTDGLIKLAAALQMTRNQTGDASSAATNLQNVFQKMTSQETVGKFKKMGIKDLRGQLDKAKKSGEDVFDTFLDITEAATKGDLSKIPLLFNDAQMQAGMRALISQRQQMRELRGELGNAAGTVDRDFAKVANDAASGMERLATATSAVTNALGGLLDKGGVTDFLKTLTDEINRSANFLSTISENMKKGPLGFMDAIHDLNEQAANDPEAISWTGQKGQPFKDRSNEIRDNYRRGRPQSTEYDAAAETVRFNDEYFRDINEGGGPINDEQRALYAQRKAESDRAKAFMAQEEAKYQAGRASLLDQLRQRQDAQLQIDHPGAREGITKDDSLVPMRGGKELLGPQIPYGFGQKGTSAPALPPAAPPEIRPQVDTGGVDQATELLKGVDDAITTLNGKSATISVQPQGMDSVLSQLREAIALISKINSSRLQMPSGGPAAASARGSGAPAANTGIR